MDALERFRQLTAWLADTDVALLELDGPRQDRQILVKLFPE